MEPVISEPITTTEKTRVAEKTPFLSDCIHQSIEAYFTDLEGEDPQNLYPPGARRNGSATPKDRDGIDPQQSKQGR